MDEWWSEALQSMPAAGGSPPPLPPMRRRRSGLQTWHVVTGGILLFVGGIVFAVCLTSRPSPDAARETAQSPIAAQSPASTPAVAQAHADANPSPASVSSIVAESPSPAPVSPVVAARTLSPAPANPAPASGPVASAGSPSAPPAGPGSPGPASGSARLRYPWKVGTVYQCEFRLEAAIGDMKPSVHGVVDYEPSSVDPAAVSGDTEEREATGTAFVVEPGGVLVTCAHCVRGGTQINVHLGGKVLPAKVVSFDSQRDLALLKVEAAALPCIAMQESEQVQLGQEVRVVGFPLSDVLGESVKITRGTIAGIVDRKDGKLFQIDASVNPGNSGGPLVDSQGRVVGIANSLLVGEAIDRVGFAIPAGEALKLLRRQGIQVAPASSATALDGPELARRVTPAVALLKVRTGPGGVGVAERRLVRYHGSYSMDALPSPGVPRGFPPRPISLDGRLVVDAFGEIESYEGEASLPLLTEPLGALGIEKLPGDGRTEWKVIRAVSLRHSEESPQSGTYPGYDFRPRYGPPGSPRYPGSRGPRSPLAPPRQTRVTLVPAMEEVRYRLGEQSGPDIVTIHKEYELATLEVKGQPPALEIKGSGTIQWDLRRGLPRKSEFKAAVSGGSKNITIRIPFTLTYQFDEKDPSQTVQPPAAPPGGSPLGSQQADQTRDPVRKVAPQPQTDQAQAEPPKDPVRKATPRPRPSPGRTVTEPAPSAGGLNLLEPDEPAPK